MPFDKQLFISYAHLDNKVAQGMKDGWVSRFHVALEDVLNTRRGGRQKIWRDERLEGNDVFGPEIKQQLPESAVLLAVVSPSYVQSTWCRDEASLFCDAAQQTGGLVVDNKSRLVKVIKVPPPNLDPLPPVMREMLGYNFYEIGEGNAPLELDPVNGDESRLAFTRRMGALGWHIVELLNKIDALAPASATATATAVATGTATAVASGTATAVASGTATAVASGNTKPLVYLADCAPDRQADREALRLELGVRGYTLLPDRGAPASEADYRQFVAEMLARCKLAIHLVGNDYGWVPRGDGKLSDLELQNQAAVELEQAGKLLRVVSLPEGTVGANAAQQAFVQALHGDANAQGKAELITAGLDALKGAIAAKLAQIENPPPQPLVGPTPGRTVFLLCDPRDRDAQRPIYDALSAQRYTVLRPAPGGTPEAIRDARNARMAQCDAVLVLYGAGSREWYEAELIDLGKARALRPGGQPIATIHTWLGAPSTEHKQEKAWDANVIDATAGFDAGLLAPFVAAVEAARVEAARVVEASRAARHDG